MKNIKYIILGGLLILILGLYLPDISKNNINNTSSVFSSWLNSWLDLSWSDIIPLGLMGQNSSDKMITSFDLNNTRETLFVSGIVNEKNKTISIKIPSVTNIFELESVISVSPGATVFPASGEVIDLFSNDGSGSFKVPTYIVTAGDGSTQEYKLYVSGMDDGRISIYSKDSFVMDSKEFSNPNFFVDKEVCYNLKVGSTQMKNQRGGTHWRIPTKAELEKTFLIGDVSSFVPEDFYWFREDGKPDGLVSISSCGYPLDDDYYNSNCTSPGFINLEPNTKVKIRCVTDVFSNNTNIENFSAVGQDVTSVKIENGNTGDNLLEIGLPSSVGDSSLDFEITLPPKADISVPSPSVATKRGDTSKNVYIISGLGVGDTQRWLVTAEDGTQKYFNVKRSIEDPGPLLCTSFEYSAWSVCDYNTKTQTREILRSLPFTGCTGGDPIVSQSCVSPKIFNCQDLQNMNTALSNNYILENDIDCTSVNFIPVGSPSAPFTGSLDGRGHTISNLTINLPLVMNVGLFGYTDTVNISNVGLINANISGLAGVGGLLGSNGGLAYPGGSGTISNSYVTGSIKAARVIDVNDQWGDFIAGSGYMVGGLVGSASLLSINNSYSIVDIEGHAYVGGLVGDTYTTISNSYSVVKFNIPTDSSTSFNLAGLVASNHGSSVNNSYYYDYSKGLGCYSNYGTGCTSVTDSQMKTASTFVDWDTNIWNLVDGAYPTLKKTETVPPTNSCPFNNVLNAYNECESCDQNTDYLMTSCGDKPTLNPCNTCSSPERHLSVGAGCWYCVRTCGSLDGTAGMILNTDTNECVCPPGKVFDGYGTCIAG
jgi:hypothetical protein